MPICYAVGGFLESNLGYSPFSDAVAWLDLPRLILGRFGELRLAPNGIDPGPPDGVPLVPAGPLLPYVGLPAVVLALQLAAQGYSVRGHGWDWRKEIYAAGVDLAARIRREVSADDPCALATHSAGGLVARAAWTELGLTGDQGRVRRIVTCGTPHYGTYTVVGLWSGVSPNLDQVQQLNQYARSTLGVFPAVTRYRYWERDEIIALTRTWPALYEMLPLLDAPDATDDPHRAALYDATNWPAAARPQQAWLDYSRDHFGPWLRSAASVPPDNVLTVVSGLSGDTYARLTDPARLGNPAALSSVLNGDGIVTQASAELAGGAVVRASVDHASMFPDFANNGLLAELILDTRAPTPPPPPRSVPGRMEAALQGPPLGIFVDWGGHAPGCAGGKCPC